MYLIKFGAAFIFEGLFSFEPTDEILLVFLLAVYDGVNTNLLLWRHTAAHKERKMYTNQETP